MKAAKATLWPGLAGLPHVHAKAFGSRVVVAGLVHLMAGEGAAGLGLQLGNVGRRCGDTHGRRVIQKDVEIHEGGGLIFRRRRARYGDRVLAEDMHDHQFSAFHQASIGVSARSRGARIHPAMH